MLEQMRKASQSLLIYVLFGVVIAVFIINFGPQSRGGCEGPDSSGDPHAADVRGETISASTFRYGFLFSGGGQAPPQMARLRQMKESVLDKLIERSLLAQAATGLGVRVTEEDAEDLVADSRIIGLGYSLPVNRFQKDGHFNYDLFKAFAQYQFNLTPAAFIEEQRQELLASHMRDSLKNGVKVSVDEVRADWLQKTLQVNLEYLRFPYRKYEETLEPTAEELAAYATQQADALKKTYESRKALVYDKAPKEARLRQLVVKGDGAEAKAAAILARIKKNEPFAKLAKELSADASTKPHGGDLGWRRKGALGLGVDAAEDDKVLGAKPGDVLGPLKLAAGDGVVLVLVEKTREGDISFEQAKDELAAEGWRKDKAIALAKADADKAMSLAKATPDKAWKDLFPGVDEDAAAAKPNAKAKAGTEPPLTVKAEETGLFARRGNVVEGIGISAELSNAAFNLKPTAPLAGPFEVADSQLLVRLKERQDPSPADFDKKKLELVRDAELAKGNEVVSAWVQAQCAQAKEKKQIRWNKDVLKYEDNLPPPPYEPCATLKGL